MELLLIRHGQSFNNAMGDEQRHHDPELTALGQQQADLLAKYFAEGENVEEIVRLRSDDPRRMTHHPHGIDILFVSAMHRALQTAAPIAKATGAEVCVWPELHEHGGIYMHMPEGTVCYGGLTRAEISEKFPSYVLPDTITENGWYNITQGEEDLYGCYARAMRVTKTLRKMTEDPKYASKRVAMVSHGNFIDALLNALFAKLPSENTYFWHYNTGVTRIDFPPNGMTIVRYINRCDHLPPDCVT